MASNPRVFLEISIDGQRVGKIEIELPYTAENFRTLCTGEKGIGLLGKPLHYKGSTFFRVIKGYMRQGGDITAGDGTGGDSICGEIFGDENFIKKHTGPDVVSMANCTPGTNGSQFYICTTKNWCFNGKDVVVGQVVEGVDVVKAINKVGSNSGRTSKEVVIVDCGQVS
ncbi:hypothetical protein UlMin_045070 [Ulmus minor]